MKKGDEYLNRRVVDVVTVEASGTFGAIREAEEILKEQGFRIGSMCYNEPIGFAPADKYKHIAKWHNIETKDYSKLHGVLLPIGGFREGAVEIVYLNVTEEYDQNNGE
jgi:hypothetical protein